MTFLWFDMWMESCTISLRLLETMAAVLAVVNARMPMIGTAAFDPLHGDWPELYRMVPEKSETLMQAGLLMTRHLQAIQSEMVRPMRSAKSAAGSSARTSITLLGLLGEHLPPLHTAVTGNARRLQARR